MHQAWRKSRVRYLAEYINGSAFKPEDWSTSGVPIIRIQNLTDAAATYNYYSGTRHEKYQIERGDILLPWSASPGVYIWNGPKAWLNQHIFKVLPKPEMIDRNYFFWLAKWFIPEMEQRLHGSTMQHFTWPQFASFEVSLPPTSDQREIASFLDYETAEADALVAKYERLIELLEEKRVAFITQAVTKGLDPNVPMKASGVNWIGEIPEHWQFQRISRVFRTIGSGTTPPASEVEWYGGDTPFVTTAELRENVIMGSMRTVTARALHHYSSLTIYPAGTILLAMYGATIGRSAILGLPATVNQACCALGDSKVLSTAFTFNWLQAYRTDIVALGVGGGQPNISQDLVKSLLIPIPPMQEQVAISEQVGFEVGRIDDLRSKSNAAIALVKEHRSALITAAVTGEIDVNNYRSAKLSIRVEA